MKRKKRKIKPILNKATGGNGMEKQRKAFIELFKAILEENDYYHYLGIASASHPQELGIELYHLYNARQPISIYGFLDSIEDYLKWHYGELESEQEKKQYPSAEDIWDRIIKAVDYLDDYGEWKD